MEAAAQAATAAGMTVLAPRATTTRATGGPTPANVDAPASCPHVIGCGGTSKTATARNGLERQSRPHQRRGNRRRVFSTLFPVQAWQIGAPPAPPKQKGEKSPGKGRMVPDVSANADPDTGYEIFVYGAQTIVGGTSAVAPLYAGLFRRIRLEVGFS